MNERCPHCGAEWETDDGASFGYSEEDERGNKVADLYVQHRRCKGNLSHGQSRWWRDDPPSDFGQYAIPATGWDDDAPGELYVRWPDAERVRYMGRCDCCHAPALYSFQLDDDHPRGEGQETCGYWCSSCGFSNAGSRAVVQGEG